MERKGRKSPSIKAFSPFRVACKVYGKHCSLALTGIATADPGPLLSMNVGGGNGEGSCHRG